MKKNRGNILNRLIHESLSKSRGRVSDIVACHLYTDDEMAERTAKPTERVTSVEYFDEPGLSKSILTRRLVKSLKSTCEDFLRFENCTWAFEQLVLGNARSAGQSCFQPVLFGHRRNNSHCQRPRV
jgi:hypothetical protein